MLSGLFGMNADFDTEDGLGLLGRAKADPAAKAAAKAAKAAAKIEAARIKAETKAAAAAAKLQAKIQKAQLAQQSKIAKADAKFQTQQIKLDAKLQTAAQKQQLKDQAAAAKQQIKDMKEAAKGGDPTATGVLPAPIDAYGNPVAPGSTPTYDQFGNPMDSSGNAVGFDPMGINPGTLPSGALPLDFQTNPAYPGATAYPGAPASPFPDYAGIYAQPGVQQPGYPPPYQQPIQIQQPGYGPPMVQQPGYPPPYDPYGGMAPQQQFLPPPAQYNPYGAGGAAPISQQQQISQMFPQYAGGAQYYGAPQTDNAGGGGYDDGSGDGGGGWGEQEYIPQQEAQPVYNESYGGGGAEYEQIDPSFYEGGMMGLLSADAAPKSIVEQIREGRDLGLETWMKIQEQLNRKPTPAPIMVGPIPEDNVGKALVVGGLALLAGAMLFKNMKKRR